ncbi:MAG: hypothetical protein RBT41_11455 [Clostridia bacterium]|jgi:hypothetical protein|nr:hypothetical protein [Clostridia bacterium]
MWTNKRSYLLLIRIKAGKLGFPLPLFLYVLEDLAESWGDLLLLLKNLAGAPVRELLVAAINFSQEAMDELTRGGRWQMAAIEADEVRVDIDFY